MNNPDDDVVEAASINCTACQSCTGVHVNFLDVDGELVATAVVPSHHWTGFMQQFCTAINEVKSRTHTAPRGNQ